MAVGGLRRPNRYPGNRQRLAVLPTAVKPTCRWHPAFSQTVTTGIGDAMRVVSAKDLMGVADVTAGTQNSSLGGPMVRTDRLGRKFWRFEGSEYLDVAAAFVANNRAGAIFIVCRPLGGGGGGVNSMFGVGSAAGGTASNVGAAWVNSTIGSSVAPYLRGTGRGANLDATNGGKCIVGRQLQVLGVASRSGAAPGADVGQRLMVNNNASATAQASTGSGAIAGAEIGRYPFTPSTVGSWAQMDVYEIVAYSATLTDAQADAIQAALVSEWSIPPIVNRLVLEGDSTVVGAGSNPVKPSETIASVLAEPGTPWLPPGWMIYVSAVSGNTWANLVTRRDATDSWATKLLSGGRNLVAVMCGRNDITNASSGATTYAAAVAWANTTTTGVLQRGWEVVFCTPIATGSTYDTEMGNYKTLLRDVATLMNDTLSGSGQAFDGNVAVVDVASITYKGASIFQSGNVNTNTNFYQPDVTHETALGNVMVAIGGDTAVNGFQHAIAA